MAHSIANRLRKLAGNRRHARRRNARRKVRLSFDFSALAGGDDTQLTRLEGYTLDISTAGVALVVPALPAGDGKLVRDGVQLQLTIELPAAQVSMRAIPVRYEKLGNSQSSLVAARFTEIGEIDRVRLAEYLRRLRFSVGDVAP